MAETRGRAVRNKIPQLSRTAGRFINTDSENSTFAGKKSEVFYIYMLISTVYDKLFHLSASLDIKLRVHPPPHLTIALE